MQTSNLRSRFLKFYLEGFSFQRKNIIILIIKKKKKYIQKIKIFKQKRCLKTKNKFKIWKKYVFKIGNNWNGICIDDWILFPGAVIPGARGYFYRFEADQKWENEGVEPMIMDYPYSNVHGDYLLLMRLSTP